MKHQLVNAWGILGKAAARKTYGEADIAQQYYTLEDEHSWP